MYGLPFTQSWVVIDVDTDVDLNQWEGCHQLCNPQRAGTYMRVSETRYRWEFQLLDGETAADYQTITDIEPPAWCRSTWIRSNPPCRCGPTRASGGQAVDTADRADVSAQRRASRPEVPGWRSDRGDRSRRYEPAGQTSWGACSLVKFLAASCVTGSSGAATDARARQGRRDEMRGFVTDLHPVTICSAGAAWAPDE